MVGNMIDKIKYRVNIDSFILLLMVFEITLFSLLDKRGLGSFLICLLITYRVFISTDKNTWELKILVSLFVVFLFYTISAILGETFKIFSYINNFKALIFTFFPLMYIAWLVTYRKKYLFNLFEDKFVFINTFYLLNYVIMLIQGVVPGFLSGFSDHINNYKEDLMSGLFGYEGTAQFGIFSIFVLIYNLYMLKWSKNHRINRTKKNVILGLIFLSILISSSLNDNKANYITLILTLNQCLMIGISEKPDDKRKVYLKYLFYFIIVLFAGLILLLSSDLSFLSLISSELKGTVYLVRKLLFDFSSYSSGEIGSIERLYIPIYILFHPQYILFGVGTAYANWQSSGVLGFPHFGQSDFSSFFALGGILFSAVSFILYSSQYLKIIGKTNNLNGLCTIAHFLTILFYFMYTQPWTQSSLSVCMAFMFIPIGMLVNKTHHKNREELENCEKG